MDCQEQQTQDEQQTNQNNFDIKIKKEYQAPNENKAKSENGMNNWHGSKFTVNQKQLCNAVLKNQQCNRDKCNKIHDIQEYLKVKPAELEIDCNSYANYGNCEYKYNCVFRHQNNETYSYQKADCTAPLQKKELLNNNPDFYQTLKQVNLDKIPDQQQISEINAKLHRTSKADLKGKLFLAPMCTVGVLPFRRFCKYFKCDVTCSEMIFSRDLLKGNPVEKTKLRRHPDEDVFGVQITGGAVENARAANLICQTCELDFLDLNAACPQDVAVNRRCGYQIAQENKIRSNLLEMGKVCKVFDVNLGVKTRIGDFKGQYRIDSFVAKDLGVDYLQLVAIHGRTAKQRYQRSADWDKIQEFQTKLKNSSPSTVFVANGDLFNPGTYLERKSNNSADSYMVGRGALYKPWIFTEFREGRGMDPSGAQRVEWLKIFAGYLLDYHGSDRIGVEKAREQFLENWGYMCRYVPLGILDKLQELNQRQASFTGRDETETLLGSHDVTDWVKISEMFFGSVPDGYIFQPKHKSKGIMIKE